MTYQPSPPPAQAPGPPRVAVPGVAGGAPVPLPTTVAEIQRLRQKAKELASQLNSATDRREEVVSELRNASTDARPGLEARLKVLDDRIVSLEREIEANSRAIANSPLELTQQPAREPGGGRPGPDANIVVPVAGILGAFGLLPLAIGYTIRMLRRPSAPAGPSPRDLQQDERLARMEQAMDAMAIELERITEGQRFVTKLMTDGGARPIAPGAAAPVPVPARARAEDA